MPGLYVADFTSVAPMGAQSPAVSISKPADQAFGRALHLASRPEPKQVRQDRPETAPAKTSPQSLRKQASATETQPGTESMGAKEDEASRSGLSVIDKSGEDSATTAAEAMAPFMAALFDESARYLQPSAQSEGVAAAERVQEFVANWLQTQASEENPMGATAPVSEPENTNVISTALSILNQYVEKNLGQATAPQATPEYLLAAATSVSGEQAQLSSHNAAELRQLMAVMMQSGRVPEPFNQQPGNEELQQQLDRILPLVISASSAAVQAATAKSASSQAVNPLIPAGEQLRVELQSVARRVPQTERSNPLTAVDLTDANPVSNASAEKSLSEQGDNGKNGLQESQLTKIFAAPSADAQSEQKALEPKFTASQQERSDTAIHMVANGPRVTLAIPPGDSPPIKFMQLASGQQLPEAAVVDQVVSHLAAGNNGETSRMLLRLNPAELGSLRIELTMEGDKLRAQLHTQTQQVQEVLDRHLPQLRDALQVQGLKIDSFRVDVQGGQSQARDQASDWQQQQHQGQQARQPVVEDWPLPEHDIPLQQILQLPAGSISLRV